jgi:hypothetical protein
VAQAEEQGEERASFAPKKWHLGIELLTDFPLQVGWQFWAELPYRIRLSTSFGEMPDLYLDTINAVAVAAGAYSKQKADLLSEALDNAFTWRLHVGWRPFKNRGAYFEFGYGMLALDAGVGLAAVIEAASGFPAPQVPNIGLGYELHSVVETLGGEVGWIWYPWRNLTVRVSLGFAATVGAQVHLHPNFASTIQRPFTRFAEDYIQQLIERYLFVPTVGVAVGWRLF